VLPVPHRHWSTGPASVRHYVLTRSAYSPDLPLEFNRYRLDLLRGITAASLRSQTHRDVTWLVLVDPADPLLREREDALCESGLPFMTAPAGDIVRSDRQDRPWGPWDDYLDFSDATLTTRIDDDDAFAPWALATFAEQGDRWTKRKRRRIFVLPVGYRVSDGRANLRHDKVNQFTTLYAPRGDRCSIMDMNHTGQRRLAQLFMLSQRPAWLWLRHAGARSHMSKASNFEREAMQPISDEVRSLFAVDWSLIG